MFEKRISQEERVLQILKQCRGFVDGMLFLKLDKPITQYHARIHGLQKKGHMIVSRFIDGKNYKEYQLIK